MSPPSRSRSRFATTSREQPAVARPGPRLAEARAGCCTRRRRPRPPARAGRRRPRERRSRRRGRRRRRRSGRGSTSGRVPRKPTASRRSASLPAESSCWRGSPSLSPKLRWSKASVTKPCGGELVGVGADHLVLDAGQRAGQRERRQAVRRRRAGCPSGTLRSPASFRPWLVKRRPAPPSRLSLRRRAAASGPRCRCRTRWRGSCRRRSAGSPSRSR